MNPNWEMSDKICHCRLPAKVAVAGVRAKHPGAKFHSCQKPSFDPTRCNFFEFDDATLQKQTEANRLKAQELHASSAGKRPLPEEFVAQNPYKRPCFDGDVSVPMAPYNALRTATEDSLAKLLSNCDQVLLMRDELFAKLDQNMGTIMTAIDVLQNTIDKFNLV
ncbi:hypothetical protein KJ807_05670 [Patescibacteria group bacterium]|nr:hypothetical protein [Patescibacteria group bacterium]